MQGGGSWWCREVVPGPGTYPVYTSYYTPRVHSCCTVPTTGTRRTTVGVLRAAVTRTMAEVTVSGRAVTAPITRFTVGPAPCRLL